MSAGKNSIDKIITTYFACITKDNFEYKGVVYKPLKLSWNSNLIRSYSCPSHCGGCCLNFTLDYLPWEDMPDGTVERFISLNNKKYKIYTIFQDETKDKCKFLNMENGLCNIHGRQPFTCDFELLRFLQYKDGTAKLLTRLFGRGWKLQRVTGERGALCEIGLIDDKSEADVKRKLLRLKEWADYFNINNCVQDILDDIPRIMI